MSEGCTRFSPGAWCQNSYLAQDSEGEISYTLTDLWKKDFVYQLTVTDKFGWIYTEIV